ncbi:MAG: hypothetical protein JNL01_04645 [Bdellovibrionales bacterium]|nr:hypothetical protein [Bdellovibrionales bacterium]
MWSLRKCRGWSANRVYWFQVPKYFTEQDCRICIESFQGKLGRRPGVLFRIERLSPGHRARVLDHVFEKSFSTEFFDRSWYVFSKFPAHQYLSDVAINSLKMRGILREIRVPKISKCAPVDLDFWFHQILEQESKRLGKTVRRISVNVAEKVEQGDWRRDRLGLRAWIHRRLLEMDDGVLSV